MPLKNLRWKPLLDIATTILTLVVLAYISVSVYKARTQNIVSLAPINSGNVLGQKNHAALADLLVKPKSKNLIIAISATCPYCKTSRSFYRSLVGVAAHEKQIQIIFAFPKETNDGLMHSFWDSSDSARFAAIKADFAGCGIGATRTLVLLDGRRNVVHEWVGALTKDQEQEVFRSL